MKVYVVNKCHIHDFNREYWLIDKIFHNFVDAEGYVLSQKSPDGSKQESIVNNPSNVYTRSYKGYEIIEYPVYEKYTEIESVKIQLEVEEMRKKLKELESKL